EANLKSNGIDFETIPKVVQFNKRDLPDIKTLDAIRSAWGDVPTFPAVALRGDGVRETFRELLRQLYRELDGRHQLDGKFGMSEEDFLKGMFRGLA
ncbi:MAG: MglA protein, partial [Myxococcales bacterium]|nr:MglA protein [Myxococcales bacterium]